LVVLNLEAGKPRANNGLFVAFKLKHPALTKSGRGVLSLFSEPCWAGFRDQMPFYLGSEKKASSSKGNAALASLEYSFRDSSFCMVDAESWGRVGLLPL
jgi:hypothetical protein